MAELATAGTGPRPLVLPRVTRLGRKLARQGFVPYGSTGSATNGYQEKGEGGAT